MMLYVFFILERFLLFSDIYIYVESLGINHIKNKFVFFNYLLI